MSFANDFKRAVKGIEEEIAYYREFGQFEGMAEQIAALEELRDKWKERTVRFAGRGKLPTEPFDWEDDMTARRDLKESMTRIIKAAAAAAEKAAAATAAAEFLEQQKLSGVVTDRTNAPPPTLGPSEQGRNSADG